MRDRDLASGAVPDWLVERLAARDAAAAPAAAVRARLAARGEVDRLATLAAADAAFLASHPAAPIAAEIRRRARTGARGSRARRLRVLAPVAALARLALWLVRAPAVDRAPGAAAPEEVRLKGQRPHLVIYKRTTAGAERLAAGARVRPGDTIQVAYVAAGARFGVIASVDGRGAVTLHLPEEPGAAHALASAGEAALPHAFVLDDSPGFERFVLVTGDRAFASALVVDALRSPARAWPSDLSISELALAKELP